MWLIVIFFNLPSSGSRIICPRPTSLASLAPRPEARQPISSHGLLPALQHPERRPHSVQISSAFHSPLINLHYLPARAGFSDVRPSSP
ncbi:hypothetical protein F4778DRAFT_250738 [Xylariomycetidae sp. FL2044]|nr:hypothetical protein F4778DRAFT_250738 [Xylariomycetidae sp. FL2044]